MLLTRAHFDILAEAVAAALTPDVFAEFHKQNATTKRSIVKEIAEEKAFGFLPEEISEFIIALAQEAHISATASGGKPPYDVFAVAQELGVLIELTPIVWHKPKPPRLFPELIIKWPEEYALINNMAAKIPFLALAGHEWYRNAVHEAIGLGGYLDYLLGRQIPTSNATLQLFIQGIYTTLQATRGEWFDDEGSPLTRLPKNVSGESMEFLSFSSDLEDRLRRKKVAQESAAKRREAAIKEKTDKRNKAFAVLATAPSTWQGSVNAFCLSDFNKVREILTSAPVGVDTAGGKTWLPTPDIKTFESVYPVASPEDLEFVEQFFITHVAKKLPTWFKATQDGTLKIRRAPAKVRTPGLDRPTRALHKKVEGLISKYGEEKVGNALLTLTGSLVTWNDITVATKMGSAAGGRTDSHDGDA